MALLVLLASLTGCAVVTYNRYNVSTSTEDGVDRQSLEGHDMDVAAIKADLASANANVTFSKLAGKPGAPFKMDVQIYNHTKLFWLAAAKTARLSLDGQLVPLSGGGTNEGRRLEVQRNDGNHTEQFIDINAKNQKAAFKAHSSAELSVTATETAHFIVDRGTVDRISRAKKAQLQVWNFKGEYCVFSFTPVLQQHLAAFLMVQ